MHLNIVIPIYKRLASLQRLVLSLEDCQAEYPLNLTFSCDGGASDDVVDWVKSLEWERGTCEVLVHDRNLGINAHNFWCIEQAIEKEHVVVLEDDLIVAPHFHKYLEAAIDSVTGDEDVSGIGLYRYGFNESNHFPFQLLANDQFNYFQKRPCSNGSYYNAAMAKRIKSFLDTFDGDVSSYHLPPNVVKWKDDSWEKWLYCYLNATNSYFLLPRYSLTTDFADPGVHMYRESEKYVHQVALYRSSQFSCVSRMHSENIYDSFYELDVKTLMSALPALAGYEFELDLHGLKDHSRISAQWILSNRESNKSEMSWGKHMKPEIQNLLSGLKGDHYHLAPKGTFKSQKRLKQKIHQYLYYFPDSKLTDLLKMKILEVWSRITS